MNASWKLFMHLTLGRKFYLFAIYQSLNGDVRNFTDSSNEFSGKAQKVMR
jgi:hypothetical protein